MKIYKYPISAGAEMISTHTRLQILKAGLDPSEQPCLWIAVDENSEREQSLEVYIIGTGQDLPARGYTTHVDSFTHGNFVWHVFVGAV